MQSYIFTTIVVVKMTLDKKTFKSKWERNILPSKLVLLIATQCIGRNFLLYHFVFLSALTSELGGILKLRYLQQGRVPMNVVEPSLGINSFLEKRPNNYMSNSTTDIQGSAAPPCP